VSKVFQVTPSICFTLKVFSIKKKKVGLIKRLYSHKKNDLNEFKNTAKGR